MNYPYALLDLGDALLSLGRFGEDEKVLRQCLAPRPILPEAKDGLHLP